MSFEMINEIDKHFARIMKKNKNKIRNKRGDATSDTQRVIRANKNYMPTNWATQNKWINSY